MNDSVSGLISIIVPAYNEEAMIPLAYEAISSEMKKSNIPFEVIFVDDGSKDGSFDAITTISETPNSHVNGISFSRNFGKEAAILAGLKEAKGDCCVVMDCDLQHPVEIIPEMYSLWKEGYEVVEGVKSNRGKEGFLYKVFAKLFYSLISDFSKIDMRNTSDFKLLDRVAIDSLLEMPERAPFFRGMSQWIGFKSIQIPYEVAERKLGTSKWSFGKLVKYSIHNICTFSSKPLNLVTWLGGIFIFIGLIVSIECLVNFFRGKSAPGFPTVICLLFISTGVIMLSLGIIGYYIAQIYDEIKARPRYLIRKRCTGKEDTSIEEQNVQN